MEEIVVTATKRGKDLQSVPVAISALSAEDLAQRGVTDVEELSRFVPNLNYGLHVGASFITIRGVGSTINSGVTETTVATYVDGLYLPRPTMAALQQVDLDRVEVLRGPQGTLYGRNATGGAVNFISKAPTAEYSGEASVSGGSRDGYGVSAALSGPITETLLFRLSGGYQKHDSYLKFLPSGDTVDVTNAYVRGALRFAPSSDLTIDLSVKWEKDEGADTFQQLFTLPTVTIPPGTLVTTKPNRTATELADPFSQTLDTTIANLTVDWAISDTVSLRSVTGYIDHFATTSFESDGTAFAWNFAPDFERPSKSFSQELVLLGTADQFEWLVGAYLYHEDFRNTLPVAFPSGLPGLLPPGGTIILDLHNEDTISYALFTDVTWSITDRFRAIGGLRYNVEQKDFDWRLGVVIPGLGDVGGPTTQSELSSKKFLPKLGLQFDLTDAMNAYAQYQRGFKSGGHDISLDRTFGSELLDAYELGIKSQWADGRLTANGAFFYYDYEGLQITNNTGPTTTQVENADGRVFGLEGELAWHIGDNVDLNLSATWLDSEYTNFQSFDASRPGLGLLDLEGLAFPQSPDFTIKAGAQWRIPLAVGFVSDVVLRGDVAYTDDVPLRYFATSNDIQKAYALGNLSATLNMLEEAVSLRVFVNNVGDKKYKRMIDYLQAIDAFDGNYGEPRTWGAQLTYRF